MICNSCGKDNEYHLRVKVEVKNWMDDLSGLGMNSSFCPDCVMKLVKTLNSEFATECSIELMNKLMKELNVPNY